MNASPAVTRSGVQSRGPSKTPTDLELSRCKSISQQGWTMPEPGLVSCSRSIDGVKPDTAL